MLLEILPLQIPALRPGSGSGGSPSCASDGGRRRSSGQYGSGGAAPAGEGVGGGEDAERAGGGRGAAEGRGGPSGIPYVKLCGLRLPDTLAPAVDDPQDAQVRPACSLLGRAHVATSCRM